MMDKIYEDQKVQIYKFTATSDSIYEEDVINISDPERIITYDDTIVSEYGKLCQFFYIPKETKNSVFILHNIYPEEEVEFFVIKHKKEGEDNESS